MTCGIYYMLTFAAVSGLTGLAYPPLMIAFMKAVYSFLNIILGKNASRDYLVSSAELEANAILFVLIIRMK